jgi:hypothetical protein
MTADTLLVGAVVAAAAGYLARLAWRAWGAGRKASGGCDHCR